MDTAKARTAYFSQKNGAKARGIEWQFTFETWVEWWGDDLDERGALRHNLQMQRVADSGPYHPDNVRKGTPQKNADTRERMRVGKESRKARAAVLAAEAAKPAIGIAWEVDELTEDHKELLRLGYSRAGAAYGL